MTPYTRRDLTIISTGDICLVIACDTCGGVGIKDSDILKLPPRYVGKLTTRVALSEVMCAGATPSVIVNGVSCEMNPTGAEIIQGIRDELENAGISNITMTGSTEDNFTTNMTALSVTIIGTVHINSLKFGRAVIGDKFILLGSPQLGPKVDLEYKGFYSEINSLLKLHDVIEIVPVGSKGIAHEVETLANLNNSAYQLYETGVDYNKSAGPATCLVVLCSKTAVSHIQSTFQSSVCIGEIVYPNPVSLL